MWRCEDVDQQVWRCEDVDLQMWRCEDVDQQMWRCEDVDLQMWGCEDVDLQVWGCEDVDQQMWGCEDLDLQMWGCEDVDLQVWRCEDVDLQMWGCEDVDLQMWGCEDVLQRLLFYEEPFAGALGNYAKTHFWRAQPPLMAPRLSSTRRAALLQWAICCRVVSPHHPQQPGREAHLLIFPTEHYGAIPHHAKQLLREVLPIWQPMQLLDHPPTASNTVPPQKKYHPSYKIAPCDEHSTSIKNTNLIKTHFWRTQPPLMAPRLSPTRCAAVLQWAICCRVVSPHHPQQPGAKAQRLIFPTEHYGAIPHHVKQLLREVLPVWQPIQLPTGPQHATHRNHKTSLIRQHWTM